MLHKVNPLYKFIIIIIVALSLSIKHSIKLNIIVCGVSLLLLITSKIEYKRLIRFLVPVTLLAIGMYMTGKTFSLDTGEEIGSSLGKSIVLASGTKAGVQLATRAYMYAFIGMLFSLTTNTSDFIYSLTSLEKLPSKFTYGVMAAVNLLPVLKDEYKKTLHAFSARGKRVFVLSPTVLVPFLIKAVRYSESIAIGMESKGFMENGSRTAYKEIEVHIYDKVLLAVSIVMAICFIIC